MPTVKNKLYNFAVRFSGVRKEYKLYDSLSEQAIDVLGLSRLCFWRSTDYRTFVALDGIDFEIKHGERVGIVGRNGAGKTTLLKLVTGNFTPSGGEIEINGEVQALMQTGLGFHSDFTGYENIRSSLIYSGLSGHELKAAVNDIIDFCELGDFINQPIKTYSLGMISRLQFAAATAIKPDIVIIDEILGAGDAYFNAKSAVRIDKLTKSGCTLLLVSHSMQQVIQFCDRCLWIDQGRLRMDGEVREVVGAYEVMVARDIKDKAITKIEKKKRKPLPFSDNSITEGSSPKDDLEYYKENLESGISVYRWVSNSGVKIVDLKVRDQRGSNSVFDSGDTVEIDLVMECEVNGVMNICTHIAIFDAGGIRVAWITSPVDHFVAKIGKRRLVSMKIDELLLSEGRYTISLSVFDGTIPNLINEGTRFDLLARCYNFSVIAQDPRPKPVFFHPSQWRFEMIGS